MASLVDKLKARRDAMNAGDPTGYAGDKGFDTGANQKPTSDVLKPKPKPKPKPNPEDQRLKEITSSSTTKDYTKKVK